MSCKAYESAADLFVHILTPCSSKILLHRGAHAKVQQLLQKHGLEETDLPTDVTEQIVKPEFFPAINPGSTVGVCADDDVSALTPIPENGTLRLSSRWETDGTTKRDVPSAPPRPPRRPVAA